MPLSTFLRAPGVPARAIMEVPGYAEIGVTINTCAQVPPVLRQEVAVSERDPGLLAAHGPVQGSGQRRKRRMSLSSAANLDQLILSSFSVSSYGPNISSRPARHMLHRQSWSRICPMTWNF